MKTKQKIIRIALLVTLIGGLFAIGRFTPVRDYMDREKLQTLIQSAGIWGALLFVAAFALGTVMQVPGLLFVSLAVVVYGRYTGVAVAWIGAVVAVTLSFTLVRAVGGRALGEIKKPWVRKVLGMLDEKPTFTVMLLRMVLLVNPPVTYALALSNIRFRDFVVGSTLGLVPPLILVVFALDTALGWAAR
jgi:uncharacterized membrane protein YdjX (TVP38/TMEM64 family)